MTSDTWFGRLRNIDPRVPAAVAATLMLIVGVMWVVPTTPESQTFQFLTERRGIEHALQIELEKPVEGQLVDGSDTEFYRIVTPRQSPFQLDVRMTNGSKAMIPGLRVFDANGTVIQDKTAEYIQRPGSDIHSSLPAEANTTYYVQVFSQRNTIGFYTLTVTARQP
jgi:hypothetical protein